MEITESIDGVPIRLTAERWLHVVENHDEVAGYYDEVLETVASPDIIVPGYKGSLIAVRSYGRQRHLCVVYRKVSRTDGFIITAYFSRTTVGRRYGSELRATGGPDGNSSRTASPEVPDGAFFGGL